MSQFYKKYFLSLKYQLITQCKNHKVLFLELLHRFSAQWLTITRFASHHKHYYVYLKMILVVLWLIVFYHPLHWQADKKTNHRLCKSQSVGLSLVRVILNLNMHKQVFKRTKLSITASEVSQQMRVLGEMSRALTATL